MAKKFGGDGERFRGAAAEALARILGTRVPREDRVEYADFCNFAMVMSLVPEAKSWTAAEKRALIEIIRAKAGRDEMRYLHLLQRHDKVRAAMLRLGSGNGG